MMTDALKAFFALLETDEDDFATLMDRFGLDAATDLQNCDLTNVDFGSLNADTLDLTGSYIEGADLSKVNCKRVIGVEEAMRLPQGQGRTAFSEEILLAISHYQNVDWALNEIVTAVAEGSAPVLAFYESVAEQELLTKRICAHYGDASHLREGVNMHANWMQFLWFYSRASKAQTRFNPASLDKAFFAALQNNNTSDDIGIYPFRPNQAAVGRIRNIVRNSVPSGNYEPMRRAFASGLEAGVVSRMEKLVKIPESIVVFSGFPPMSKRFYRELRDTTTEKLSLIFLCSSIWEPLYLKDEGKPWRRVALPAYSIGEPLAVQADIRRLISRIEMVSGGRITVTEGIRQWMEQFVGKPLATLKQNVAAEFRSAFPSSSLSEMP
jgi:hypothetical protein